MSGQVKALLTIASLALATPVAAPPTTAFDGNYVGVSAHVAKRTAHGRQCPRATRANSPPCCISASPR